MSGTTRNHVEASPRNSRYVFENFADLQPRSSPWLIKGVLPARGVAFIVGQSKAGKSFLAIDIALNLAVGSETVLGRKATPCGVVYIAAEDADGCRGRVAAWRTKYRVKGRIPFDLVAQGLNLLNEEQVADLRASLVEASDRFRQQGSRLGVVVLDTLSKTIPGVDENASTDMSTAFAVIEELASSIDALVLVVAHFGKSGGDKGIRGWSGFDANSDATITLEREADDPNLRTLTIAKVKNGIDGGRLAFRLEPVGLEILDEDGDELTSCVPVYEVARDRAKGRLRPMSNHEQIVLAAVEHLTDHGPNDPQTINRHGVTHLIHAVSRDAVRECAFANGLGSKTELPAAVRQRFHRALDKLITRGRINVEGSLVWLL
ncbi:AAA family ATPase [Brevundimonas sp.]|uniref:AAA family ATPase n=1 Tax=Brevundimonas sp. TaxID=1871086 RepID=UPI001D65894C|nr:AAA family ATPase [Brevundimonas sp.]MBA3999375.1 hypothetical protein [Brevundimonas sp.]